MNIRQKGYLIFYLKDMNKIALILDGNLRNSPFIYNYFRILESQEVYYDVIVWDRDGVAEESCINYENISDIRNSKFSKVRDFLGYRRFVLNRLKSNDYNKIIIFSIVFSVLLYPYLKKSSKLYIMDVRDHSPILNVFPKIIHPIVKNSFYTVISSPGFLNWLPKFDKYLLSHNFIFEDAVKKISSTDKSTLKYVILTIGLLRDFEANKLLIDSFKNEGEFLLKFVGTGLAYEPLMNYAKENNIENVHFLGRYEKKDEFRFFENVSLVNILTDNNLNSRTLMSNRFYMGIRFKVPLLVSSNTVQSEFVNEYSLGISINNKETLRKDILNYLKYYNRELFQQKCDEFLKIITKDQEVFEKGIIGFINK